MVIAIAVGSIYVFHSCRKSKILLEDILVMTVCITGFAITGAKVLYIFVTYDINTLVTLLKSGNLYFLIDGGLVFLGGLFFGIIGALVGAKISEHKLWEYENSVVPVLPLCHAIGRVGCLLAGCCYGVEYGGFCAVYYSDSLFGLSANRGYFPVQILEATLNVLLFLFLHKQSKKQHNKYELLYQYVFLYACIRFFTETLRGDTIRGIYLGASTSQWISIIIIIVYLFYRNIRKIIK